MFIGEVPMSIKVGRVCSVGPAGQAGLWEMGIVGHSPGDFAGSDGDMSSVDLGGSINGAPPNHPFLWDLPIFPKKNPSIFRYPHDSGNLLISLETCGMVKSESPLGMPTKLGL